MPPLFLLGPTASGKHEIALACAGALHAEIISIDSMKVYREMDIGTAKPSSADRARIPHHLIDICDPSDSYNAARFVKDAHAAEQDIVRRGKVPLYVGGTGLYYKALVYGMFEGPAADPAYRAELEALAEKKGVSHLHEELRKSDPTSAERIHPNDLKRIVRALEVVHQTGRPISSLQTQFDAPKGNPVVLCLRREREDLRKRIEARTRRMIESGLVDEVRRLLSRPGGWGREARASVGYKEVQEHMAGKITLEEAVALINRNTWRFTRRQMTWFRSFKEAQWVDAGEGEPSLSVTNRICKIFTLDTDSREREQ